MSIEAAYEAGFEAGERAAWRQWVDLTEDEIAQLVVDYGGDDYSLVVMTAAKVQEKNA